MERQHGRLLKDTIKRFKRCIKFVNKDVNK